MATKRRGTRKAPTARKRRAASVLARATAERDEALKFQAATQEILASIRSSVTDAQPVFDAIVKNVLTLFGTRYAAVFLVRDGQLHLAGVNVVREMREARKQFRESFPQPIDYRTFTGKALRSGKVSQLVPVIGNPRSSPQAEALARTFRYDCLVVAPLVREGEVIGAIGTAHPEAKRFDDKELAQLKAFADQAVIAIENARLFNETKEALERQTSISEVLAVISSSPTDLAPILDAVASRAAKLCDATDARIFLVDGSQVRHAAGFGDLPVKTDAFPAGRGTSVGTAIMYGRVVHVRDIEDEGEKYPLSRDIARKAGWRTTLNVPLMRENRALGAISLRRREVRPFTDRQAALLKVFADQAAIAIENTRLFNETKEALERQTATADILKVISGSPSDVRPVFDAIVESAMRLLGGFSAAVTRMDGKLIRLEAFVSMDPASDESLRKLFPMPLEDAGPIGEAVRSKLPTQVADMLTDPRILPAARESSKKRGYRSIVHIPMLREGVVIGLLHVSRVAAGTFSERHVGLMTTFADQAAIAIDNARLFNETKEALEKQTATADILQVLSGSPSDTQPVFDAIVRHAARLCESTYANVFRYDGERIHLAASEGGSAEALTALRGSYPALPNRKRVVGRVVETGRVVHVEDTLADPEYDQAFAGTLRLRRLLGVPLVRGEQPVGAITVGWAEPGPISNRHEELLRTFADQAVIAIENVRLFNETKEALEQQTATADILRVMSGTPTDTRPVFDAIVQATQRLVAGNQAGLVLRQGSRFIVAGYSGRRIEDLPNEVRDAPLDPNKNFPSRAILEARVVHVTDWEGDDVPEHERLVAQTYGVKSGLFVPLVRKGEGIGALVVLRESAGRFEEKEVSLLQSFADQAVIAIENVRLFNETKEALERQTATAQVLSAISGSPTDVTPVYETILDNATRLCEASFAGLFLYDGEYLRNAAQRGAIPEFAKFLKETAMRPSRDTTTRRAALEKRVVQVEDVLNDPGFKPSDAHRAENARTVLSVPMLREGALVGVLTVWRREPRRFSEKQVALLKTFADQAVIAIENVRLFNETKEALDQQKASAEVLGAISGSIADTRPVFEKILASCERLFEGELVGITLADGDTVRLAAYHGPRGEQLEKVYPLPLTRESGTGWAILNAEIAHFPDIEAAGVPPGVVAGCRTLRVRAIVFAPMLFEGKGIGAIWVARAQPGAFTDKQIAQLRTFADQAVIAIQNARLFNETKEALEQQTATAEILKVISGSPTDTQPVFEAIVESAARLFYPCRASLILRDGSLQRWVARAGPPEADSEVDDLKRIYPLPFDPDQSIGARVMAEGRVIEIPDTEAPDVTDLVKRVARAGRFRSATLMPLLREGAGIGLITISSPEPGFTLSKRELALLQTFADQAVIAIENVRLFNETKEALDQQRASAEVLRVISSSVADTEPVFEIILRSCERLFAGLNVGINVVGEDGRVHIAAYHGRGREELERHFPVPLSEASGSGAAIMQRAVVHYPDVEAPGVPEYARRGGKIAGNRSVIFAPMLWEEKAIGAIFVGRDFTGAFSEKEIALLKTFADQAVIAIQNARLFREIQEKSAQLEVANKHKSDFLANMSHELRTPLNAIIGFSEVLSERMFGEVNEKQAEYLKDIHESGRHLLSLINDILDLSKIEAGRMELELSSFDLPSAVSNAMTLVRERAQRHGIQLGLEMDPGLGELQADERKVKQILLNLLSNAVKFTPDGGRVEVSAKATNGKIEIAVRDTGIGIAPEDHAAVFEEFKQVGRDYTRKAEGTGLGLALTRRLVELHGGEIALESELGKGATFTVRLPLR